MELQDIQILLAEYGLNVLILQKNLKTFYIRGSGSGGQKRNKTSSTVQIVDNFNYLDYIPQINRHLYKGTITIKSDRGRSQIDNYNYALEEWYKILKKFFFVTKERKIQLQVEENRKKKLSTIYQQVKSTKQYRDRFTEQSFD